MPRTSVISAFINDNTSGAVGPDGTQYYVELTIQSSQVSSDLTNFPVYVDLSDMPAVFFTNVQSDGGDIRVTESDGTTRCPVDLVSIDTSGSTGELHFLASSLNSSSNTTFQIYYGTTGTSSQPAVGDTYGRNSVWSNYAAVYHLEENPSGSAPQIIDSTGNGNNATSSGSMTSSNSIIGKIGTGLSFGASQYLTVLDDATIDFAGNFTLSGWTRQGPISTEIAEMFFKYDAGNDAGYRAQVNGNFDVDTFGLAGRAGTGSFEKVDLTTPVDDNTWRFLVAYRTGTTWGVNMNGGATQRGISISSGSMATSTNLEIHGGVTNVSSDYDELRLRASYVGSDWIAAEYINQNTPTTFYTVGTQQTV